jgi:hypothetical protein
MIAITAGLAALLGAGAAEPSAPVPPPYQAPGTRRMQERLAQWARELGDQNPYANAAAVRSAREKLVQTTNPSERLTLHYSLASELLNAGKPDESIATVSNLFREFSRTGNMITPSLRRSFRLLEGVAYLRLGEQQNCLEHHNPDSCLLPIRGAGIHQQRLGATAAETLFSQLARQRTNDLGARWLLNIAAMTLGHYPSRVPADLVLPARMFESEYPLPKFPEIGAASGIAQNDLAGGVVADDFDGDGLLDLWLTSWHPMAPCHLYRNAGNGKFVDRTQAAGLGGVTGGLNIFQADYDNDGWLDVYLIRGAWLGELGRLPDSLLRNNGDGTFADVTEEAGLLSFHPGLSAAWFDANNDGWIDLFVGNETVDPRFPHPCELFLNDQKGKFRAASPLSGAAVVGFVRGVATGDFDNDGWTDVYLSCLNGKNILLRNQGLSPASDPFAVKFNDVTSHAGVSEPFLSFPTWFWDYDNDGWQDLFVCGYGADTNAFSTSSQGHATLIEIIADKLGLPNSAEKPRLYHNNRDGTFQDVTRAAGLHRALLAMGANYGDLDNDGFLDLYLGTGAAYFGSLLPNEMFRNSAGARFQNVTTAGGFGHLQKGHGIAFADLNNDGQQDIVLNVGGAFLGDTYFDALFANPGNTNRWLGLKLIGQQSNRGAIGARVKVAVSQGGQRRHIERVVGSGGSFGASPLRLQIGLGEADRIERVEIRWPVSASTNVLTNLVPDQFYQFTEGAAEPVRLNPPRFAWSMPPSRRP